MPFSLEAPINEPVRCYFAKDHVEWVELRVPTEEETQDIREKCGIIPRMVYEPNPLKGNDLELVQEAVQPEKWQEFIQALNAWSVPAWHLVDNDGNEIPWTAENVTLMLKRQSSFRAFVNKHLKKLMDDQSKLVEAEIKNS